MARLLTCYKCNQRFPNKKLNIHLNIQHNIKDENLNSFVCEVDDCNRSFSSLKTLNAHSKAQHKVKNDSVETKIDFRYNTREQNLTNDDNEKRNEKNNGAQDTGVKSTVNHNEQTKNSNNGNGELSNDLDISTSILSSLNIETLLQDAMSLISEFNSDPTLTRSRIQSFINGFDKFINSEFVNKLKTLILINTKEEIVDTIEKNSSRSKKFFLSSILNTNV